MARNANESLLLATTVQNSFAMGKIIEFVKDPGEENADQEKARRLFEVWEVSKANRETVAVSFTRKTLFRAQALRKGSIPIGQPSEVVL